MNPHESKYVTLTSMYEPGMKLCHVEYQIYNTHVIEPSIDNVESYENQYTIKINVTNILDTPVKIFKEQIKVHPVDLEEPIESTVNTNDFITLYNVHTSHRVNAKECMNSETEMQTDLSENQKINIVDEYLRKDEKFKNENIQFDSSNAEYESKLQNDKNASLDDDYLEQPSFHTTIFSNEKDVKKISTEHIPIEYRKKYDILLEKFNEQFAASKYDVPPTNLIQHSIEVQSVPKSQKPRFLSKSNIDIARKEIDLLEKYQIIKKENNPRHVSNLVLVTKNISRDQASKLRDDKTIEPQFRLAQDLRDLNKQTIGDPSCTLPILETILEKLQNKIITSVDQNSGYYSIPLSEDSKDLTSFYFDNEIYSWQRMTQGLSLSLKSFKKLYELAFSTEVYENIQKTEDFTDDELKIVNQYKSFNQFLTSFVDDVNIYSVNHEHHLVHLKIYFYALKKANLKISKAKTQLATKNIKIFNHMYNSENSELAMNEQKVSAILNWSCPSS